MKTFLVNYGNVSLPEPVELKLGVRSRVIKGTPMFYGHVLFANGVNKRTKFVADVELVKTFIRDVAKTVKVADFPFNDSDGERQWWDFDPNAPTL
tara:strand:+ start:248 stop:532 length:285 start_codon:yes stop_codon:yes gene_type:complete